MSCFLNNLNLEFTRCLYLEYVSSCKLYIIKACGSWNLKIFGTLADLKCHIMSNTVLGEQHNILQVCLCQLT